MATNPITDSPVTITTEFFTSYQTENYTEMFNTSSEAASIPVINQPIQVSLLLLILVSAIITNSAIILNISRDRLKQQMVHFLLIRHVCITDLIGAVFVLSVPLVSFIKGHWEWGDAVIFLISMTTSTCWTMHLVAVLLYRVDRVLAIWLPTGRYPLITTRILNVLLVLTWIAVISGCCIATLTLTPVFLPALALCIPKVPLVFFIVVFTFYCLGIIILTTSYIFIFIRRKRRKRRQLSKKRLSPTPLTSQNSQPPKPTSARYCVFAGYAISIGHLILYLVAMVTVAFIGEHLPTGVAFTCGLVIYCDFIIQPISLLLFSTKLRTEVVQMVCRCSPVKTELSQMAPSTSASHACNNAQQNEDLSTSTTSSIIDITLKDDRDLDDDRCQHK